MKIRILILSFFLLAPGLAAGKTWIVDDDGGPGVDFEEIQPAIDAAASGAGKGWSFEPNPDCELLGDAARSSSAAADVAQARLKLVTTAACKAAIKINHPLTTTGMQALLDDLYATTNPTTCPHGRPILFRLSLEEIERAFRRR